MTMRLRVAAERRIRDAGFHRRPGRPGSAPVLAGRTHAFRDQAREVVDASLPEVDVLAWLATTPLTWRKSITHVAIDVSATYRAAIRTGLPHTRVVIDRFHVVQHALGGPAPHHRRGPRPTRTSHRSGVVGQPAPAAQP
ncbi:transposase [Streptomyces olivaceoviridis]|uniref:transposase n=1 Tax=Streptomyces olivaceoviridis TaxID=1921 RepID=UPI0036ADE871